MRIGDRCDEANSSRMASAVDEGHFSNPAFSQAAYLAFGNAADGQNRIEINDRRRHVTNAHEVAEFDMAGADDAFERRQKGGAGNFYIHLLDYGTRGI